MLPQFLVQNDLISNPSKTDFNLDWFLAAPIVNLNFFHIEKLLDEQEHYRQLLRPWTPAEDGLTTSNYTSLKKHEYGYATQSISLPPLKIYAGTLVGRINQTTDNPASDFVAITQTLTNYYIKYDTIKNSWVWQENRDPAYPAIIRPNYANLENSQKLSLNGTEFILKNGVWSYNGYSSDSRWRMSLGWTNASKPHPMLMRDTDIVFGRIIIKDDNNIDCCIANIPITLDVQWNPNTSLFIYTFSFKDQNFPSNATVELY